MTEQFDLVVIGSGPAGEKGAAQAAYFGHRVALIERDTVPGGACINSGTIPSKTLRETALYLSGLRQRGLYGLDYSLRDGLTIGEFMHRERVVVEHQHRTIRRNLDRHGIVSIPGNASLGGAGTVRVVDGDGGERMLEASTILIATGSAPYHPQGIPFEHPRVHDSDSILHLDHLPRSMVVVGGGVIGTEYAGIFTALGLEVVLVDGRDGLLPFVDREIAGRAQQELTRMGLEFVFGNRVDTVTATDDQVQLLLSGGRTLVADVVLFAAGRQSNVEGLGLEQAGVRTGPRGLIEVDENYQTTAPGLYAAGDVIGFPSLASTSMEQARVAMCHAFDIGYKDRVSPTLPFAIYSIPEIATVGLSAEQCEEQGIAFEVGRSFYDKSPRGQIIGDTDGMLKLVFSPTDRRLLGAHMVGEMASELIHIGAHVLDEGGAIDAFIRAVYNYPTLADSYKYAAYDGLGRLGQSPAAIAKSMDREPRS